MHQVTAQYPIAHPSNVSSKSLSRSSNISSNSFELEMGHDYPINKDDLVPSWVDENYSYDPSNPRKPNMRELVEALSGQNIEDLYADPHSDWQAFSRKASDILYGVVGSARDTRDWDQIMSSLDIASTASKETGKLHEPYIDICSKYETVELTDGTITEVLTAQVPVLANKYHHVLSTNFSSDPSDIFNELERFGGKSIKFDEAILEKIKIRNFDFDQLQIIQNYVDGSEN